VRVIFCVSNLATRRGHCLHLHLQLLHGPSTVPWERAVNGKAVVSPPRSPMSSPRLSRAPIPIDERRLPDDPAQGAVANGASRLRPPKCIITILTRCNFLQASESRWKISTGAAHHGPRRQSGGSGAPICRSRARENGMGQVRRSGSPGVVSVAQGRC
jgi:hypothetical protein